MHRVFSNLAVLVCVLATLFPAQASVSGTWSLTGSLATPRLLHTATLLPSGEVLAAGGIIAQTASGQTPTATAERYDPFSGTWTPTSPMADARSRHTATLLPNGMVLVAGGRGATGALREAELYDPATATWAATSRMTDARFFHTATLLPDGRVLVTGGVTADPAGGGMVEKSAEIYDPLAGAWTQVAPLANARYGHRATLLADGRILITGGSGPEGDCIYKVTAEIYDPDTNHWTNTLPMATARGLHGAVLLPDGRALNAGGLTLPANCAAVTASTEIYDAVTRSWSAGANMEIARGALRDPILLSNGSVLVAGGRTENGTTASAELYDPAADAWSLTGSMVEARTGHTLVLLGDGRVLAAGGIRRATVLSSAELYEP